jgi:hypothetical protein
MEPVAATDAPAPGTNGVFTSLSDATFTGEGELSWQGTVIDGREGFWRTAPKGIVTLIEGDPNPSGGAFNSFNEVFMHAGGHATFFRSPPPPSGGTVLYSQDETGVRVVRNDDNPGQFYEILRANNLDQLLLRRSTNEGYEGLMVLMPDGTQWDVADYGQEMVHQKLPGYVASKDLPGTYFDDDGIVTLPIHNVATGVLAYAHGPPWSLKLIETAGWIPDDGDGINNPFCCSLLSVSSNGIGVFSGYSFEGPPGSVDRTFRFRAGSIPANDEVFTITEGGDGTPAGAARLMQKDGLAPIMAPTGGFAFTGTGKVGDVLVEAIFAWTATGKLQHVASVGTVVNGYTLRMPMPRAFSSDGRLLFQDTDFEGHKWLFEWDAPSGAIRTWFAPGTSTVKHPIEGELPVLSAYFGGTSRDLDVGHVAVKVTVPRKNGTFGYVLLATPLSGIPDAGPDPTNEEPFVPPRDDGCGCSTPRSGGSGALLLAALALLAWRKVRHTRPH